MFLLRHQGNKGWWNGEASRECSHISRHILVVNCHSNTSSEIKSISCQVTFQEKYRVLFCDMMSLTISAHSQPFLLSWPLVCLVWFKLPSVACKLSVTSNLVLVVAQIQAWTVSVWCLNGSSYALTVPLVQQKWDLSRSNKCFNKPSTCHCQWLPTVFAHSWWKWLRADNWNTTC